MSGIAVKFLILTIKTVSKPVSKRLKSQAEQSTRFKNVCIEIGRFMNRSTHFVNVRLAGGRQVKMKPLGEQEAVSRGADVVGEGFVYGTSVLLLVGEYARRDRIKESEAAEKARRKLENRRKKDAALEKKFTEMRTEIIELQKQVQELKNPSISTISRGQDAIATAYNEHTIEDAKQTNQASSWLRSWLATFSPFYFQRDETGEDEEYRAEHQSLSDGNADVGNSSGTLVSEDARRN